MMEFIKTRLLSVKWQVCWRMISTHWNSGWLQIGSRWSEQWRLDIFKPESKDRPQRKCTCTRGQFGIWRLLSENKALWDVDANIHCAILRSRRRSCAWLTESETSLQIEGRSRWSEAYCNWTRQSTYSPWAFRDVRTLQSSISIEIIRAEIHPQQRPYTWTNGWMINWSPVIAYSAPKKTMEMIDNNTEIKKPHL